MRHGLLTLLASLAVGFIAANASAEPVLLNGSFEFPAISPGSIANGGGDDWMPSDPNNGAFIVSNGYSLGGYGNTPYGTQFLFLNPVLATGMFQSDSQTIAGFEAGVTYVLGLDFADASGGPAPTLTISVAGVFNGSQTYTAAMGGPYGSGTIPFTSAVFFFTPATSGTAMITVTNSSIDTQIAVDNVSLYGNANIPEPMSAATFLLGASLLGGVALARRRVLLNRRERKGISL